jgi:hypothetical protein
MSLPGGNFIANGLVVHNSNFMGKSRKNDISVGVKEDKSESVYDSLRRRISGTYAASGYRGKLFLVSSKKSIHDFTERRLHEAMRDKESGVFVRDYASWEVRPRSFIGQKWWKAAVSQREGHVRILGEASDPKTPMHAPDEIYFTFPDQYYKEFQNDPEGAARDIAGIALESFRPFFSNRQAIEDMQKPNRPHPFHVYEWDCGRELKILWENLVMTNVHGDPVPRCCPTASRHCHIDLSKNKDATGFCVGHAAGEMEVSRLDPETHERRKEEAPVLHIDLVLRIKPPRAGEIDHQIVRSLIYKIREGGIPIKSVSADTWMGLPNLQMIAKHGFETHQISTQRTLDPYLSTQSALYERRIESPVYPLLSKELRELELNDQGTKVDHPKTGCFAGDTQVRLLDGRSRTFEQLVAEYGDGRSFHVYTIRDGKISVGVGRSPRLTKKQAEVVAVTLDNGRTVRCTPDHRFMLRDGVYREAKDLSVGDSLMPLYTKISARPSRAAKEPTNHKVVSVTPAGRSDVYDLTVDETSNFALEAGVFVHNSKDIADAFAATVYYLATNHKRIGGGSVSRGVSTMQTGQPGQAVPTGDGNFRWPDEPVIPKLPDGSVDTDELPSYIIT